MRLKITESKNAKSLYIIRSTYENGKHSSKIVEKLGTYDDLLEKLNGQDPIAWAKTYIADLNEKEKADKLNVTVAFSPAKCIEKNQQVLFNGGCLFLQAIYYALGLDSISKAISKKHKFAFDLNSILSNLLYARILFPASKLATMQITKKFLNLHPLKFNIFTGLLALFPKKAISFNQNCIKIVAGLSIEILTSSTTIAQTISLNSNRNQVLNNMVCLMNTDLLQLFKWGFLWMVTAYR